MKEIPLPRVETCTKCKCLSIGQVILQEPRGSYFLRNLISASGNDYLLQVNQFQQYYDALPDDTASLTSTPSALSVPHY